jgi:repressor LexA
MYLSKNLKYLRLKHNFSQDYIADMFGYKSYTTIQKWEMGTSEPSLEKLSKLSELYNVDMNTLYTVDLENSEKESRTNKVPIVGTIAAGIPTLAVENIEDYFVIDNSVKTDFALKVKGDSMINVGIYEGDIAFIKRQPDLENGEIGAVLIENEATLKRVYKQNGSITLVAENSKYPPKTFTNGDIRILGKLSAVLHQI